MLNKVNHLPIIRKIFKTKPQETQLNLEEVETHEHGSI